MRSTAGHWLSWIALLAALQWAAAAVLWVISASSPETPGWVKAAGGAWAAGGAVALILAAEAAARGRILGILLAGAAGAASCALSLAPLLRQQRRGISPEKVLRARHKEADEPRHVLSLGRRILERAGQLRRTLEGHPSEIEVEMCLMGYRTCCDELLDMRLKLAEELPASGPLRRLRLQAALWRSSRAVRLVREALPPGTLRGETLQRRSRVEPGRRDA